MYANRKGCDLVGWRGWLHHACHRDKANSGNHVGLELLACPAEQPRKGRRLTRLSHQSHNFDGPLTETD